MTRTSAGRLRRLLAAGTLGVVVLAVGACGSDTKGTATDTTATTSVAATGDAVTIKDFAFAPTPLTVKVGTKITVTNRDTATHTLTADDKSVSTGHLAGGATGSITAAKAGEIAYHCEIHDYMKGVIRVEA